MAGAKISMYEGKEAIKKSSHYSTTANAENANMCRDGDLEASKENPSSSAHPVSIPCKVRLPTYIPVVQSLVGLDKEEKAIELFTVSRKSSSMTIHYILSTRLSTCCEQILVSMKP